MLSFSETFFLKTTCPIALISLLVLAYKSKIVKPTGMTLLDLKAQILDTASSSGVERCRPKTFSILSILAFALRSASSHHHHFIINPVLSILCLTDVKRVISPDHSSVSITHLLVESLIYHV